MIMPSSIFYHIPKTGGTWIREVIRKSGVEHENYKPGWAHRSYREVPYQKRMDKWAFAFIRHPVEWYRSYWAYRHSNASWDNRMYWSLDKVCKAKTFDEFIEKVIKNYKDGYVTRLYKHFLGEKNDRMHFVGRQENLEEDFLEIIGSLEKGVHRGIAESVSKKNVSKKNKPEISNRLRDKIVIYESWVVENFYD